MRLALIPIMIALGALATHLLFPLLRKPQGVLAQPIPVVTSWGESGVLAWLLYASTIAVAGAVYLGVVRDAQRRSPARIAIVAAVLASLLAALGSRYIFSSDVYAYAAYGGLAASHQDPYVVHTFPPTQLVDAGWTSAIAYEWPSLPTCIYGQAFVEIARVVVLATHFHLAQALLALRVLEIAAFVAVVALAPTALLAIVVGLNPVAISTVADGHNDALVLLAIALAYLLARRAPAFGGGLAAASLLLKATGGVAAAALAYALAQRRFAWGVAVGMLAAAALQYGATQLSGGYQAFVATDFVGTPQAAFAIALRGAIALALALWALVCAGRGLRSRALAAGALAIWALYPNDYPWYSVWLLPLAAFTLDRPEGRALIALTFTSTLRYLSDVYGFAPAAPWLEAIVVALPLSVFAWRPAHTEKFQPS